MAKALVLLSGGLDSMLAARVLMEQGIEVTGLSFRSCFFNTLKAQQAAESLGIKLIEIDFSPAHLDMVKKPAHGYGQNMNPCIDCHGMMLKYAQSFIKDKYDFIATGEVLGQRPMSQNREALKTVGKIAGLQGNILRPLSAKLLEPTEIEKADLVDRNKLLDIQGRTRKAQVNLAKRYGITEYPSPAGGCFLTDPIFGEHLAELFKFWPNCTEDDVEIIKMGRIFWINAEQPGIESGTTQKALVVVARNADECEKLEKLAKKGDIMIELNEEAGPHTLLRTAKRDLSLLKNILELTIPEKLTVIDLDESEQIIEKAALLTGYYATRMRGKTIKLKVRKINN